MCTIAGRPVCGAFLSGLLALGCVPENSSSTEAGDDAGVPGPRGPRGVDSEPIDSPNPDGTSSTSADVTGPDSSEPNGVAGSPGDDGEGGSAGEPSEPNETGGQPNQGAGGSAGEDDEGEGGSRDEPVSDPMDAGSGATANGGNGGAEPEPSIDAGPAGGAGPGSGGNGNEASGCAGHDYLLCEDFEDTEVGDIPDGWYRRGDEVWVDDEQAHRGSKSLKLDAIPFWERRIAHDASMLGPEHWGRIYYRVELPVPDGFAHSTMVAMTGVGPTNGPSEYRLIGTVKQAFDTPDVASRHNFLFNVQPEESGEFTRETSYDWFFDDEWHCAEYHIDAANQSYWFALDGNVELEFENGPGEYDRTDIPSSFDELRVGWNNYQEVPPGFVAFIDDVVFDDEPIGCEN